MVIIMAKKAADSKTGGAKKPRAAKAKKEEPVVECVAETVEVVEVKATEPVDAVAPLVEEFTDFMAKRQQVGTMISSL